MDVKWLIEDFERDNSFGELAEEVKRQGYSCEVIRYTPFQSGDYKNIWPGEQCVVFQGSIQLARQLQKEKKWIPGIYANWNNYRCQVYYAYLYEWLLNKKYTMLPFRNFLMRKSEFFETYHNQIFIRPDDGAKTFSGCVITPESLTGNSLKYFESETAPETLILISSTKNIHREWRLVCSKETVITGSRYKTWGQVDYNSDVPLTVIEYAENILKKVSWRPDSVFIMDVADERINNTSELHILEIGAFSVAGLYHCNFEKIVNYVSAIAKTEWNEYTAS